MRKDFDIFSKDELAMLKNFANKAVIEDKKIHGIQGNNNINKQNQFISKKEEKKHLLQQNQQNQVKKPEPSKMVNTKPPELKKKKKQ